MRQHGKWWGNRWNITCLRSLSDFLWKQQKSQSGFPAISLSFQPCCAKSHCLTASLPSTFVESYESKFWGVFSLSSLPTSSVMFLPMSSILYIQPQFSFHIDTPSFQNTIALFPRFPMNFRPVSSICFACTLTHTLTFSPSLHLFTINGMEWDRVVRCSGKFCPPYAVFIKPHSLHFVVIPNSNFSFCFIVPKGQQHPFTLSNIPKQSICSRTHFEIVATPFYVPRLFDAFYPFHKYICQRIRAGRDGKWIKKKKTTKANDASLMIEETWMYKCMNP